MHLLRASLAGILAIALLTAAHADPTIKRGINFGNALETPHEGDWGVVIQSDYFPTIRQAGFDTVRVPILWVAHTGPAPAYVIDPAFFQRIDWVVEQAKENHLNTILDYHFDADLMKEPDAYAGRFIAIWKQIAAHYSTAPESVLFELMNEPSGKLDSRHWNALIDRALIVIRPTNPLRTVIVGPVQWNSFNNLASLELPDSDHHLLVTYHYYLPMQFTHQGAAWISGSNAWMGTKWEGTDAQKDVIAHDFGTVMDWAKTHNRPIFMGEFGADSKGDMDSRARWINCCARTAESLGIAWSYWEFCAKEFGAYDPHAHQWRKPLLDALIPPALQ